MKFLAVAAAAASLIIAASFGASASAQSHSISTGNIHGLSILLRVPTRHGIETRRAFIPLQTGPTATATSATQSPATATATSAAQPTATAQVSPTTSPFPDPVALLNQAVALFERITDVHFEDIIIGDQTNIEHLSIDGKGEANCTAEMATVTASDTLLGTSQKKTQHYKFIQKGKKFYKRQLVNDKTHHKWTKSTRTGVNVFSSKSDPGFSIDNPLICPSAASSGGSGGSADQLKDVVNQGSVTYHGKLTWHVTATDVSTDAQGNTTETPLDFYIGQAQALLYGDKESFSDPADSITESLEQVLSQFGKKVTVPTPKIGATKP